MPKSKKAPRKIARFETPISRELHSAISDWVDEDGRSLFGLAAIAGVDEASLRKFQSRERSLKLESVDKLAVSLGLQLVRKARSKPKATPMAEVIPDRTTTFEGDGVLSN